MKQSFNVKVWATTTRTNAKSTASIVRWSVDGKETSRSFRSAAQADSFRSGLVTASRTGEPFDPVTCLPVGHGPAIGMTCLELARALNAADWSESAGTSRRTLAENLSVLLCFLVPAGRRLPDGLRQALFAELKGGTLDVRQLDAVRWLEQTSLPVGQVTADVATRVLASAGMKLDGTALSASKQGQRRTYLSKLLGYAVAKDLLPANPVRRVKRQTARKASTAVSKREIGSPELARTIIGAVADSMHRDFVKTVYLSGARPSEVAALRVTDCKLPDTGWGVLFLRKSAAEAGKSFTDGGNVRDDRGLKHRSEDEDREVPASPELVALLKARIGTAKRGIVFQNGAGGMASGSAVNASWRKARAAILEEGDGVTLRRVYLLRHLHGSAALNAGVPIAVVAARLGHDPSVLLSVYAKVLEAEDRRWNEALGSAL